MLMINVVYLIVIAAANVFIQLVLTNISQAPGDPTEWLSLTNLRGPSLWINVVGVLSMFAANTFYIYGRYFRKVYNPTDVKGGFGWWLGLYVIPTLLCSVIAFVLTLPADAVGVIVMFLMYMILGVGLYHLTTLIWSPPSVRRAPWGAGKL